MVSKARKGYQVWGIYVRVPLDVLNVPHTETNRTPAETVFGRAPCTHISMVLSSMGKGSRFHPTQSIPVHAFMEDGSVEVRDH